MIPAAAPPGGQTIAVIIPTSDRTVDLDRTLRLLAPQVGVHDEVVVVNDGPSPLAPVLPIACTVLRTPPRSGPGVARNLAAQSSDADWLIFLDDDDAIEEDWLHAFRALTSVPGIALASCGYVTTERHIDPVVPHDLGPAFGNVTASHLAGTFAVRRSAFLHVGGFDESLRSAEFTELMLRLLPSIAASNDGSSATSRILITHTIRPREERSGYQPEVHWAAASLILERHGAALSTDPRSLSGQLEAATNAAARLRLWRHARRLALRRWRLTPFAPRDVTRLLMVWCPPIARRYWRPPAPPSTSPRGGATAGPSAP